MQPAAAQNDPRFSEHYKRLQRIEQCVVAAVQLAGQVMGELAKAADADPEHVAKLGTAFMESVQEAQQQLLAAVKGAVSERSLEASVYHQMAHAAVTLEQVNATSAHLAGLQRLIARHRAREEALRVAAAAAAGAGAGEGGAGGAAVDDDVVDALMQDAAGGADVALPVGGEI